MKGMKGTHKMPNGMMMKDRDMEAMMAMKMKKKKGIDRAVEAIGPKYDAMFAEHSSATPNAKAPLGEGGRFAALEQKLAKKGAKSPGALAAWIGRKKLGKAKFQKLAAAGR